MDTTAQVPLTAPMGPVGGAADLDSLFGDEPDQWPSGGTGKGIRVRWPAAVLIALLIASAGLWGGGYLQRHTSSTAGASSPFGSASAFASRFGASRSGTGGTGGFPGSASSGATAGTVTDIIGDVLYVTEANGSLVSVDIGPDTTIDRNAKSSLSALHPGDTVTVQGTTAKNGTVAATSVSATQAGVTAGGFG